MLWTLVFGPEAQPPTKKANTINDSHANFITDGKNKDSLLTELYVQKKEWSVKKQKP
jgi:hypothetical protein